MAPSPLPLFSTYFLHSAISLWAYSPITTLNYCKAMGLRDKATQEKETFIKYPWWNTRYMFSRELNHAAERWLYLSCDAEYNNILTNQLLEPTTGLIPTKKDAVLNYQPTLNYYLHICQKQKQKQKEPFFKPTQTPTYLKWVSSPQASKTLH